MAKNTQVSDTGANAEANAFATLFNSGTINIYSGTQPANANTALSGNTLLVTLTFGSTAFGSAASGVITANAITSGIAVASGTASFFRCLETNGTTVIMDGTCDVSANTPNLVLPTTSIVSGVTVGVTSFTHTVAEATSGD